MSDQIQRDLGRHEAKIEALQSDMDTLVTDVKAIRDTLAQARGGWKTLLAVAGMSGAVSALVVKLAPIIGAIAR